MYSDHHNTRRRSRPIRKMKCWWFFLKRFGAIHGWISFYYIELKTNSRILTTNLIFQIFKSVHLCDNHHTVWMLSRTPPVDDKIIFCEQNCIGAGGVRSHMANWKCLNSINKPIRAWIMPKPRPIQFRSPSPTVETNSFEQSQLWWDLPLVDTCAVILQ